MRSTWVAVATVILLGCRIPNEDHCGRRDGDATCRDINPTRPYCSLCEAEHHGCVATIAQIPAECRSQELDSSATSVTTSMASSESETNTGEADTDEPDTDESDTDETDTDEADTDEADTDEATDETDTGLEPECGNGIKEPGEQCDGTDFGDSTCADPYQLPEGMLICVPDQCVIDTSQCCLLAGELCEPGECCNTTCNIITNKCGL